MSVLSHDKILETIENGEIVITPFDPSTVGPASVDFSLSNEFRVFKEEGTTIDIRETTDFKDYTEKIVLAPGEGFTIKPGQLILGITRERLRIPETMCAILEGRSRFARLGLFVHVTAGFIAPGSEARTVLEIYNSSSNSLVLHPGARVCQFAFLRLDGASRYSGRFVAQDL